MSLGNCRLKEISDKYWSVAESIFGFKEDIDCYKFILDEPNETKISGDSMLKCENEVLNLQLKDALHDRPRDGLVTLSSEIMIEVNNKILAEDYEAALSITMKGIADYGGYRELLDLKRILERKCLINNQSGDNEPRKPMLTITGLNRNGCKDAISSSDSSEYSYESKSSSISSSSCTTITLSSESSYEMSSTDVEESSSNYSSSTCSDSTEVTKTVSIKDSITHLTKSSSEHKPSIIVQGDQFSVASKHLAENDTETESDIDEDINTDVVDNINLNNAVDKDDFCVSHNTNNESDEDDEDEDDTDHDENDEEEEDGEDDDNDEDSKEESEAGDNEDEENSDTSVSDEDDDEDDL